MSPSDRQTLLKKLTYLRRMLERLARYRTGTEEEFLADMMLQSEDLVSRLIEAKKFRNVLVHVYADVDPTLVYKHLMDGFFDLEWFSRCLAQHLKLEE